MNNQILNIGIDTAVFWASNFGAHSLFTMAREPEISDVAIYMASNYLVRNYGLKMFMDIPMSKQSKINVRTSVIAFLGMASKEIAYGRGIRTSLVRSLIKASVGGVSNEVVNYYRPDF